MKPRTIVILVLAWVITLPIAWWIGFSRGFSQGNIARISEDEAHKKAQVDYLVKIAYPPSAPGPFTSQVPPPALMVQIETHKEQPLIVRSLLHEQLSKDRSAFIDSNMESWQSLPPAVQETYNNMDKGLLSRIKALTSWEPDQISPTFK